VGRDVLIDSTACLPFIRRTSRWDPGSCNDGQVIDDREGFDRHRRARPRVGGLASLYGDSPIVLADFCGPRDRGCRSRAPPTTTWGRASPNPRSVPRPQETRRVRSWCFLRRHVGGRGAARSSRRTVDNRERAPSVGALSPHVGPDEHARVHGGRRQAGEAHLDPRQGSNCSRTRPRWFEAGRRTGRGDSRRRGGSTRD
jgi:hypothetical protein